MIPYTNLFENKKNQVIQASVIKFEKDHVVLDQPVGDFGDRISFVSAILAPGTIYPIPAKASTLDYESTHKNLVQLRSSIKEAKSIVIVGGGPVGIELAGEIREVYKDKRLTIVHDQENLLDKNNAPEKIRVKLADLVTSNNVKLVFNDSVILPQNLDGKSYYAGNAETKSGKSIDSDLVLLAFGNRPQTAWLKSTQLGSDIVSANGYVKVKSTLQVDHPDLSHVFVVGDAADLKETKLAFRLGQHVPVVIQNVTSVLQKSAPTAQYKKGPDAMIVTFGSKQGAGFLPFFGGLTVGSWVTSKLKAGSLFVEASYKTLNAKKNF
jgi:NADH dehydrogenase FAD-containing subunit